MVLITPIATADREHARNSASLTLADVRAELEEVYRVLSAEDPQLRLIHGLDVLGLDELHLLGDGMHPTAEGYRVMAARLGLQLAPSALLAPARNA